MEAMKMENAIAASENGRVKEIWMQKGDTVANQKTLIVFD
jgi:biotin carboxyl carrier protein